MLRRNTQTPSHRGGRQIYEWYHFSMEASACAGFVLAGGRSSRMGRDKALIPFRNSTLLGVAATRVAAACGSVTVIGPPERYAALGYPVVADDRPGCGPMGGIETALLLSKSPWSLLVACDMPGITEDFLRRLVDEALRCGGDCLVPVSPEGRLEPLCAVYHRNALPRISEALQARRLAVREAVSGPQMRLWHCAEKSFFFNVNTPEELARHSAAETS